MTIARPHDSRLVRLACLIAGGVALALITAVSLLQGALNPQAHTVVSLALCRVGFIAQAKRRKL